MDYDALIPEVLAIAADAGEKIMAFYRQDYEVTQKQDDSPLTEADMASHHRIVDGLRSLTPKLPILSEEEEVPWEERRDWDAFWLVDPIDGTKDFIKQTGEFTVNIALIENGVPVMGVVTVPALGIEYWGTRTGGAFRRQQGATVRLQVADPPVEKRVVASKNHMNAETEAFIDRLGPHCLVQAGSSLKFCRIAEGEADIYPRVGPTCEWDTGAAQAVLEAAGGQVLTFEGDALRYGKESVYNPHFVAAGSWFVPA
ncbi:3'(2'),5'-bisphosphate nucleotidase CysQ [Salicola sp. Rm-C-2C1-2]|uniref:3'(2'),5'-bisphosphate nucleotidase CysQ n=1 Tax=Salicola sp. Rm-C-2C1-2 TaxID=3141321 RepID=UPI0032E4D40D